MPSLDPRDKPLVQQASSQAIQSIFNKLSNNFPNKSWIESNNYYSVNSSNRITRDCNRRRIKHNDLSQYIAASVPLHCLDGWSYLGRAIECHYRGDIPNARHLAYYAELRAAISILASQGIGIFNTSNVIVDKNEQCIHLPHTTQGTHKAVWYLLKEWATTNSAKGLITSVIQPRNTPLSQWLSDFSDNAAYQISMSKILLQWGLDLEVFERDRNARNESSYRPHRIVLTQPQNYNQDLNFVCEFWNLFQYGGNGFENLDYYLLRQSLVESFCTTYRLPYHFFKNPNQLSIFQQKVENMLLKMGIPETEKKRLFHLLTNFNDVPILFKEASNIDQKTDFNRHFQIISRASFLLRIATGANAKLFSQTTITSDDVRFWWEPFGLERGFWTHQSEPEFFADLWQDIDDALDITWPRAFQPGINLSIMQEKEAESLAKLGECERIALWGFVLE